MNRRLARVFRKPAARLAARLAAFLAALLLALFASFGSGSSQPGRVTDVDDGDSFMFRTREGEDLKVRLYGVDAPEGRQAWGPEAGEFTRGLLAGREADLTMLDTDQYGRKVALVRLEDGRSLNEELLRNGHAWVYRRYCEEPFCAGWMALEREARNKKKGLWSRRNPIAPWNWRQRHN